jgi:indolepyruvate ferredoxin oxidoreductase alpha subunit
MKVLMSGNEAIARGAYECGVRFGAGYPGTPSTEILENFAKYEGVYAEWAPNEKVALEVGIGAALAGARALVTMKHVGVNVAADPSSRSAIQEPTGPSCRIRRRSVPSTVPRMNRTTVITPLCQNSHAGTGGQR